MQRGDGKERRQEGYTEGEVGTYRGREGKEREGEIEMYKGRDGQLTPW